MTPIQVERNKAFVAALRVNPKKAMGEMRDAEGGRCCLQVAYDVAQEMGAELPEIEEGGTVPPEEISLWYGWDQFNPLLTNVWTGEVRRAVAWNDGRGPGCPDATHPEIADMFKADYCSEVAR